MPKRGIFNASVPLMSIDTPFLIQNWSSRMINIRWTKFERNSTVTFISYYYMALPHKDWELPNLRIWLAKMDIDRGLDFPI